MVFERRREPAVTEVLINLTVGDRDDEQPVSIRRLMKKTDQA